MLEQVNDNNIEKMRKSFFKYLIPSMVATVLIGLYIVVDGYFIGNAMGDIGLAAINLVYPIGSILYSFGMMIGIGGAVLMSISLGSNDLENFNKVKVNTFLTLIFGSVILTIILFIFKNNLITLLGAKGEIFDETNNYITIIILASFSQTMSSGCIPMIRNYGKTIHAMSFMATGLIINIILDYFFIYVLRWGMRGAAFATVSAQFVVVILSIYYLFIKKDHRMRIRFSDYDFNIVKRILSIGLSPFGLHMSPSFIVVIANLQCLKYGGNIAISAYSVLNYLMSSILLVLEGIAEGCQPLISYFQGAKEHKLKINTLKKGITFALILSLLIFTLLMINRNRVGEFFGSSLESNNIINFALPIISFVFIFQSIVRLLTSYFYASGRDKVSNFITYLDPLFVSPLCLFVFPLFLNLTGIWIALPAAQFILLIVLSIIIIKKPL